MQNTAFFSIDNLKRKALPFLFTTAVMAAIINLYTENIINIYTVSSMLLTFGVYAMCDFMIKHKKLSVPIYLLAMMLTGYVLSVLFSSIPSRFEIFEWFMTGGETIDTIPQYMFIVVIGFGFFISSVSYYFSHVIYRLAIFTLLSLIPCAIYVKAAMAVPIALVSAAAVISLFIFIADRRSTHMKKYTVKGAYGFTSYTDFAIAAVLIAVLIPKPSVTPYYEKFEAFSNRFAFWGQNNGNSGEYMMHSGNADDYQELESKLIYNVYTDTPQYFKIQVFDKYDPDNRWWTPSGKLGNGLKNWEHNAEQQNLSALYQAYSLTRSDILNRQKSDISIPDKTDEVKKALVQAVDYPSQFIISPVRTAGVIVADRPDETILRSDGYEIFPSATSIRSNGSFTLSYYDENFAETSGWLTSGLCDITADEFSSALTEMLEYFVYESDFDYKTDPLYTTVRAYAAEAAQAANFSSDEYAPVSDTIQSISDEITAGLVYDHEKAAAIESYFNDNGFIYDIAYRAPKELDTPEYFITESKRGSCSDFATAFSLLARAAGLTVRYTEGFVCRQSELSPEIYDIYTEDAHAYAEVYIPGAGWLVYDASAVDLNAGTGNFGNSDGAAETDSLSMFIICLAVFISLLTVVVLILLMPVIERKAFSLRLKMIPPEKAIILIYGRLCTAVNRLCEKETDLMTSAQLGEYILSYTGISADDIILPFEKVCYGNLSAEKAEIEIADMLHKEITSSIKKVNKEKRKHKKQLKN